MTKNIIAVIAAPLIWGLIMLPGNQIIFQFFPEALEGQLSSAYLFSALIASFFYSAIAGAGAAAIARTDFEQIGIAAGIAVLAVGALVQWSYWDLFPQWYHLAFLFWLIPLCMVGANVVRSRRLAKLSE
ncbi:MAG: hypothetical protein NXH95_11320 [Pseudomonadaceae bacterium]|nr:hypothetical protein [Pseudomonadaceae bacterium]